MEGPLGPPSNDLENVSSVQNLLENFTSSQNLVETETSSIGSCMYCKRNIDVNEWKFLKCFKSKCSAGLVHFSCLGFEGWFQDISICVINIVFLPPDISVQLSAEMKKNYRCRVCSKIV